ncbi:MAG TPA: HisA/HisF-related TIM barrel protein [Candidatus Limnocylindrales bacterium]|nr:HisA/HisF-related TIM barrel protein [Candidatus Limnocylindrales bacterium]
MQVIPVIDLKGGYVVHAKKGERDRYEKIQSILVDSAEPLAVLKAFQDKLGCSRFYIADLDAIQRKRKPDKILSEIVQNLPDGQIMVDAGVNNLESALQVMGLGIHQLIVGSETLSGLWELASILKEVPSDRVLFSLDMKEGKVLSESEELRSLDPVSLIHRIKSMGIGQFIFLELAKVGTESGIAGELLKDILREHPDITLLVGGGIRGVEDLISLKELGVRGALIATAFHNGRITREDLEAIR